jgi:hypothetical protein
VSTPLPDWYQDRYSEDGNTMWIASLRRSWEFAPEFREGVVSVTRGQAKATAASEWGEPFTWTRARKVWMRKQAGEDPEYGWVEDMAWECKKDDEGAMPYWRVDFSRPDRQTDKPPAS